MRERRGVGSSATQGPVTRSRDQGPKFTHGLVVEVMESVRSPCSTAEAEDAEPGDLLHRRHVVVSDPLERNLEVVNEFASFNDQPARICHRVRGSGRGANGAPLQAVSSVSPTSSSSNAAHHGLNRSPTRRMAASSTSSCPSPLPHDLKEAGNALTASSNGGPLSAASCSPPTSRQKPMAVLVTEGELTLFTVMGFYFFYTLPNPYPLQLWAQYLPRFLHIHIIHVLVGMLGHKFYPKS